MAIFTVDLMTLSNQKFSAQRKPSLDLTRNSLPDCYQQGQDLHKLTASLVLYPVHLENWSFFKKGSIINRGLIYGQKAIAKKQC